MARKKKVESRRLSLGELRAKLGRRVRLTGEEIAEAAELYDVPFNSYGKLRAYIDEFDRLPDPRFLKCERKNRVMEWQF